MLYLALLASVLAFSLYYPVVRTIGPAKAAYSSVIVPIIAMGFSTWLEGYRWTPLTIAGALLALGGMVGALSRSRSVVAVARRRLSPPPMADIRTMHRHRNPPRPTTSRSAARIIARPTGWCPKSRSTSTSTPSATRVRATLDGRAQRRRTTVRCGSTATSSSRCRVRVDGATVELARWTAPTLVIDIAGDRATVETEVAISPAANSKLMGLYASGGMLCTQCEAEGFRRITFFPDRPDVLSRYTVRMEGDAGALPGPAVQRQSRRRGRWRRRPPLGRMGGSVPQALLSVRAGRRRPRGQPRQLHDHDRAARSSSPSGCARPTCPRPPTPWPASSRRWRWDEQVYGREYDLDLFNIVAVSDFNMGAMENKSLNIFNTAYVLADPDTATDADFDNIARVVAHEYFHNWSGNRVTCRDWFQLSLKEGFTVFRDQSFSADMGSAGGQADRGRARAARRAIPRGFGPARPSGAARQLYRDLATSTPRPSTTRAPS